MKVHYVSERIFFLRLASFPFGSKTYNSILTELDRLPHHPTLRHWMQGSFLGRYKFALGGCARVRGRVHFSWHASHVQRTTTVPLATLQAKRITYAFWIRDRRRLARRPASLLSRDAALIYKNGFRKRSSFNARIFPRNIITWQF